jgi:hypothetical protein
MSEAPHGSLTFAHRFKSGALCRLTVDLATVKAGTFRPTLVWSGRPPSKKRELIAWTLDVFVTVANRAQASIRYSFWREPGRSETWDCRPGERPRRIKREAEPCRNVASAIMAAAIAAWQSDPGRAKRGGRMSLLGIGEGYVPNFIRDEIL